jgi:prepilin-type N-terminal cleavage/methylation domain-containing protein
MKISPNNRGYTLAEIAVASAIISVVGLLMYCVLNFSALLGAKNAAINTAHQSVRTAMTRMLQDLHSAVSQPYLVDTSGTQVAAGGSAAGFSFQKWSSGPHLFTSDAAVGQSQITIKVTPGQATPVVGQRLIVPTHQIEDDITAVSGNSGNLTITLAHNLPVAVTGTSSYSIVCFITDRCSYMVVNDALQWHGPTVANSFSVIAKSMTNVTPFTMPTASTGAVYSRSAVAINLSTANSNYSNRGFKSANILLNEQVPIKGQLTTYQ